MPLKVNSVVAFLILWGIIEVGFESKAGLQQLQPSILLISLV